MEDVQIRTSFTDSFYVSGQNFGSHSTLSQVLCGLRLSRLVLG